MPTANSIAAATLAPPDRTPSGNLMLTLEHLRGGSQGHPPMGFVVAQKWGHSYEALHQALHNIGYNLLSAYVVVNSQMVVLHPLTWPTNAKDMRVTVEKRFVFRPAPTSEDEAKTGVASTGCVSTVVASTGVASTGEDEAKTGVAVAIVASTGVASTDGASTELASAGVVSTGVALTDVKC